MIAIGSDHGGFDMKCKIVSYFESKGIEYKDFGCYSTESVDYPDYVKPVCNAVLNEGFEKAVLVCGTGIGVSIAANKIKGIRAALCSDSYTARLTREHNNSNVLCLGARVIGDELAKNIVDVFLTTEFSNEERHINRINKLES